MAVTRSSLSSWAAAMAGALSFLFLLYSLIKTRRNFKAKRQPPEAGGGWPLIGHLQLLRGAKPTHLIFTSMADKYGPIFTMRLGVHKTLIVSNWETAKECFTVNDQIFATRPKCLAFEVLGYDYTMMAFSLYGPLWRQARKIATVELLSSHRIGMLKHTRESEVQLSIKEMYDTWVGKRDSDEHGVKVEMKRWFGNVTLNAIFKMVVGKRFTETFDGEKMNRSKEALRNLFDLSGAFVPADYFPFLRWLDLGGFEKAMKNTAEELDNLIEKWLDEHKNGIGEKSKAEQDFMDVMVSLFYGEENDGDDSRWNHDTDKIIKSTCLTLILAGSDTTTGTMTWTLCLLLNNERVLSEAQRELDEQVGDKRQVNESDLKNLVYLNAVIKESMRMYPVGPLAIPHESMEDCTVGCYHIPAGTRLLVNLWKMQRDPRVWTEPEEFRPERFLTTHKDVELSGHHYELMPFGSGRRMCPGVSLALQTMQLTMAALLHGFEISAFSKETLDLSGSSGLTSIKETPLEIYAKPRLARHLYA